MTTAVKTWIRRIVAAAVVALAAIAILSAVNLAVVGAPLHRGARPLIERSRAVRDGAGPRYQHEALGSLAPNRLVGEVHRLDELLETATVVREPDAPAQPGDTGTVFGFEFEDPEAPGMRPAGDLAAWSIEDGVLRVEASQEDYLTNDEPIAIPRDAIADIVIRARAKEGTRLRLGWNKNDDPRDVWRNKLDSDLIADGEFRTYVINGKNALRRGLVSGDVIRRIALIPSEVAGSTVEIDFIRFVSKRAKYGTRPRGTDYETLGKEMRRAMYLLAPQTVQYSVRVPDRSPVLDFGIGVLLENDPVEFEVEIAVEGVKKSLFSRSVSSPDGWTDVRLDLGPWAGRDVDVALAVRGGAGNVALWSSPIISGKPDVRFNVVILLEDALRADHLSHHGYELPTSPERENLLAASGVTFLNAYSQAAKTRPSVPALMTSLYPTATGVWGFADALDDEYLTLAEVLRSQGFATASFLQNGNAGPFAGLHQGFDRVLDYETIGDSTEGVLGEQLSSWLERHRRGNFFLYLHVKDPHGAYDPPPPFDRWYEEKGPGAIPVQREDHLDAEWVEAPTAEGRRLLYDGQIRHNDSLLPRFLAMLDALDLRDDTLLILTADHGEFLGEHGLWEHVDPTHRQVVHVPLDLFYPRKLDSARRVAAPVQLVDVMPTILELAGVDPEGLLMHGESLVDLLDGRRPEYWESRVVLSEEPMTMKKDDPFVCGSLFFRNWHVIGSKRMGHPRIPLFLRTRVYDSIADPDERARSWRFVADPIVRWQYHRIVKEIQENNVAAWKSWTGGEGDTLTLDPDVREHLKALGYIN